MPIFSWFFFQIFINVKLKLNLVFFHSTTLDQVFADNRKYNFCPNDDKKHLVHIQIKDNEF
jgi:hypothetical protein